MFLALLNSFLLSKEINPVYIGCLSEDRLVFVMIGDRSTPVKVSGLFLVEVHTFVNH